jgi:hypothetical protein
MAKEPDRTEPHSATRGAKESAHRSWWRGVFGNNLRRFRNREERERYMDSLEWEMEDQREQIQHTLEQTTEDSGRRRKGKALEKLRSALPSFPSLSPVRGAAKRETPTEPIRSDTPSGGEKSSRKPSAPRSWWQRTSST